MRRNWRANRLIFFFVCISVCVLLLAVSMSGATAPIEGTAATPMNFIAGLFTNITRQGNSFVSDLTELQSLRERNAELEEALARYQAELVELREINNDYRRLSELVEYASTARDQDHLVAEVISYDQNALLRTMVINRGVRHGVARGMPVVTGQGLVGRITDVTANAARVMLITDPNSNVNARLQTTRAQGRVEGQLTGNLRMKWIPLDADVQIGDVVLTSGLGGNFPPDIQIGQVESRLREEFALNQEAEVRSLVDFDNLEFVLVITSFQPIDISAFE